MNDDLRPATFRRCACGRSHDVWAFLNLPNAFTWSFEDTTLICRNCICGSTIAFESPKLQFKRYDDAA